MTDTFVAFVLSVFGGLIGAGATYWFGVRTLRQEIRADYDQELRTDRREAYVELWKEFEPLAVYAPDKDITYGGITALGVVLRSWYFEKGGGLLMTDRARDVYFLVQDVIDRVAQLPQQTTVLRLMTRHWTRTDLDLERKRLAFPPAPAANDIGDAQATWQDAMAAIIKRWEFSSVPDDDFVLLQFLASSLRTLLAEDLHARNRSILDRA